MSHDDARSSQHGDATLIDYTNCYVIVVTILLIASAQRARRQSVSFWSESAFFFCGRCIKTMRTEPSYSPISFLPWPPKSSLCFGMISDEEGAAPSSPWCTIRLTSINYPLIGGSLFFSFKEGHKTKPNSLSHLSLSGGWDRLSMVSIPWAGAKK